jgi:hypothetical protein
VLFNDSGVANGDAGLVYNKTTDALSVGGALGVTGAATLSSTLAVTGATTLTGAATVQGLTVGKGNNAIASNTAFGNSALAAVTIATNATAIGNGALDVLTDGDYNTAVGNSALGSCTIGVNNTAIGHIALGGVVSGIENTGMGTLSAYQATGNYNTGFGARTFQALAAGANNNNTAIGASAGFHIISGSNNGFFGSGSYSDLNPTSNSYNYGDDLVQTHKFRNGNVVVGNGNVVMSTAGKGIDFSVTANSSGNLQTSELLNDYEEGTWVPTDASGAGLAITSSACRYTKIGRAVTIQGIIDYPSTASVANALIAGLPFAYTDAALMSLSYTTVAYANFAWFIGVSGYTELYLLRPNGSNTTNADMSLGAFRFFGTYYI